MTPLTARMAGIVRSPRATLVQLAGTPRAPWVDVLAASTLATFAALALLLATDVGRTALVDQWERTAIAFGTPVDDAFYAQLQAWSRYGVVYAAGLAMLMVPVLTLVVSAVVAVAFRSGQTRVPFGSVLSITSHASVIMALRQIVAAPINYVSETLASPTTFVQVVTGMDEGAPLARFLGVIDVFVIWWAVILALGVAALVQRRARPIALTFTGVYIAIALLLALAMAATGGTA